jgi:hypothetical protein
MENAAGRGIPALPRPVFSESANYRRLITPDRCFGLDRCRHGGLWRHFLCSGFFFYFSGLRILFKLFELIGEVLLARSATLSVMSISCSSRNQATYNHVLLQAAQIVAQAPHRGFRQYPRCFLEGCR